MAQSVQVSMGVIGSIAHDPRNDRLKGVFVPSRGDVGEIADFIVGGLAPHPSVTRISVRVLASRHTDFEVLHERLACISPGLAVEALVPVRAHPWANSFLYIGWCGEDRRPSAATTEAERRLYSTQAARPLMPLRDDLTLEELHVGASDDDVRRILEIYATRYSDYLAEFSTDLVRGMIEGSRVFVTRNGGGRIVSVCVAEVAHLPTPEGAVPFVELSDAATHPDHVGRGYYSTTKHLLAVRLREELGANAVLTTEARANSGRVVRSNTGLGFQCAGYQPAHCRINGADADVPQIGPHGNLFVFYAP